MAENRHRKRRKKRVEIGPLIPYLGGFATLLLEQQYSPATVYYNISFLRSFSHWLETKNVSLDRLTDDMADTFYWQQRQESPSVPGNLKPLLDFLNYLRSGGVIPTPPPQLDDSEIGCLVREFQDYLMRERGIAYETSFHRYLKTARHFLVDRFGTGSILLEEVRAKEVHDFLLRHTSTVSRTTAQLRATVLRSFLRFLHLRGYIHTDLGSAVPRVAGSKLAALPKFVPPEDVKRILASCDQSTATGRRDYAILLLFARLGLRAAEVVAMRLEDIDWASGEICIRGKGARRDRLPLPQDVGEALAGYLKDVRPPCPSRRVFIRMDAPFRGFKSSSAIYSLVRTAFERAGVEAVQKGPHILRHSLATQMLRQGASLVEIGEILRHSSQDTTRIYAKVDMSGLRELALAWPVGGDT